MPENFFEMHLNNGIIDDVQVFDESPSQLAKLSNADPSILSWPM